MDIVQLDQEILYIPINPLSNDTAPIKLDLLLYERDDYVNFFFKIIARMGIIVHFVMSIPKIFSPIPNPNNTIQMFVDFFCKILALNQIVPFFMVMEINCNMSKQFKMIKK